MPKLTPQQQAFIAAKRASVLYGGDVVPSARGNSVFVYVDEGPARPEVRYEVERDGQVSSCARFRPPRGAP
jgi:hypothetical protein